MYCFLPPANLASTPCELWFLYHDQGFVAE